MKRLTSFLVFTIAMLPSIVAIAQEYRLPFDGRWFVMSGGDTPNVNHHMRERSQWFGLDFMKTGPPANRGVAKNGAKTLTDFYSWQQPILAPVAGVVRVAHDGEPDNPVGTRDREHAFGNYVVIEAAPNRFVYLAHLQQGTVAARVGQQVKAGELLGKCGNSGNSSGPHLHLHVQNQLEPYTGVGQNITFKEITVLLSGKQFDRVDWPLIQGLFVWQGEDG